MLRTITLGSCVHIQGKYVPNYPAGIIQVSVGSQVFSGHPIR